MVKFTEVKDLERVRDGDVVVFPANERRLDVSVSTFAKMGLSVGRTFRSANNPEVVGSWLVRKDAKPRAFMVVGASHMRSATEDELLLGLDAVSSREREDPKISEGALVPFGPAPLWPMRTWAACWSDTHEYAVQQRLLSLMGTAGAIRARRDSAETGDLCMNQVWDGNLPCIRRPESAADSREHVPALSYGETGATLNSYMMDDLANWCGPGWGCKRCRIRFSSGFMGNLKRRGAVAMRPTAQFASDVTDYVAEWMCEEIAKRFGHRIDAGRRFLEGLAADVKRDGRRAKAYKAAARKLAPRTKAARRALISETGVVL